MKQTSVRIMLHTCSALMMVAAAPLAGAQTPAPAAAPAPSTAPAAPNADQVSYLFGLTFGEQMHNVGITDQVTIDTIARGLKDGLGGKRVLPRNSDKYKSSCIR